MQIYCTNCKKGWVDAREISDDKKNCVKSQSFCNLDKRKRDRCQNLFQNRWS